MHIGTCSYMYFLGCLAPKYYKLFIRQTEWRQREKHLQLQMAKNVIFQENFQL